MNFDWLARSEPVYIEFDVFVRESAKAILIEIYEIGEIWLPKSQIQWDDHSVKLPLWLAEDKGLA